MPTKYIKKDNKIFNSTKKNQQREEKNIRYLFDEYLRKNS